MPNLIATLAITMTDDGQVQVAGPIENKVLCYGLLEVAKDIINDATKKSDHRIVTPGPAGLSLVTKG